MNLEKERWEQIKAEGKALAAAVICKYCHDTGQFGHDPCPYCCRREYKRAKERQKFERIVGFEKPGREPAEW